MNINQPTAEELTEWPKNMTASDDADELPGKEADIPHQQADTDETVTGAAAIPLVDPISSLAKRIIERRQRVHSQFERLLFINLQMLAECEWHQEMMEQFARETILCTLTTPPRRRPRYECLRDAEDCNAREVAMQIFETSIRIWARIRLPVDQEFKRLVMQIIDRMIENAQERERLKAFALSYDGQFDIPDRPLVHHLRRNMRYCEASDKAATVAVALSFLQCHCPRPWDAIAPLNLSMAVHERFQRQSGGQSILECQQLYNALTGLALRLAFDCDLGVTWGVLRRLIPGLGWQICTRGCHEAPPQSGGKIKEVIDMFREHIEENAVARDFRIESSSLGIYHLQGRAYHAARLTDRRELNYVCTCPYTEPSALTNAEAQADFELKKKAVKTLLDNPPPGMSESDKALVYRIYITYGCCDNAHYPKEDRRHNQLLPPLMHVTNKHNPDTPDHSFLEFEEIGVGERLYDAPMRHHRATNEVLAWSSTCHKQCSTARNGHGELPEAKCGRTGCPGLGKCRHRVECLAEGSQLHGGSELPALNIFQEPNHANQSQHNEGAHKNSQGAVTCNPDASADEVLAANLTTLDDCKVSISFTIEDGGETQYHLCILRPDSEDESACRAIPAKLVQETSATEPDAPGFVKVARTAVPFLTSVRFRYHHSTINRQEKNYMHIAHLCHNDRCINFMHDTLEWFGRTKGRPGCPGSDLCRHHPSRFLCGGQAYA